MRKVWLLARKAVSRIRAHQGHHEPNEMLLHGIATAEVLLGLRKRNVLAGIKSVQLIIRGCVMPRVPAVLVTSCTAVRGSADCTTFGPCRGQQQARQVAQHAAV